MKGKYYCCLLFSVIFCFIALYSLHNYIVYKAAITQSIPIEYTFTGKEKRGGRGSYYVMNVVYKNESYTVGITGRDYVQIDDKQFPDLFYSDTNGIVCSEWDMRASLRVFVLFSIGLIAAVTGVIWYRRKAGPEKW